MSADSGNGSFDEIMTTRIIRTVDGQPLASHGEFQARLEVELQRRPQGTDEPEGPWRLAVCHRLAEIKGLVDMGNRGPCTTRQRQHRTL